MGGKNTVLGVSENIEGLLAYLLSWLTGIIFLLIEKENAFVRFHAMQSVVTFGGLMIIGIVAGFIPFVGDIVSLLLAPVNLILWILLMVKAYQGEMYKLPIAGDFAEGALNK